MQKELRDRWVTALRSGAYDQAKHTLRNTVDGKVGYCCLGVLGTLLVEDGKADWRDERTFKVLENGVEIERGTSASIGPIGGVGCPAELPYRLAEMVGLNGSLNPTDANAIIDELTQLGAIQGREHFSYSPDTQAFLAMLNDHGASFAQIADVIERVVSVEEPAHA